jgi:hypothetical protein
MINIRYIKFLFALGGIVLLFTSLADKDWNLAGTAVLLTIGLWFLGYGVERLWLYINRSPGGTRLSRFLIGR